MKRIVLTLSLLAPLAFAACSDDTNATTDGKSEGVIVDSGRDGDSKDAPNPPKDAAPDAPRGDATPEAGGDTSVGDGGADALASCPSPINWQRLGGFVAYRDKSTLTTCSAFLLERTSFSGGGSTLSCNTTLPSGDADVAKVLAALGRSDVQSALAKTAKLYGRDMRPSDGQVFEVDVAGRKALIGVPCNSSGSCTPIPAGLTQLRKALDDLTKAQRAKAPCAALNP